LANNATEIAAFVLCMGCMWWAAWMMLRSHVAAGIAVFAACAGPIFSLSHGARFTAFAGDVYMAVFLAAVLALWLRLHFASSATSPTAVLAVGFFLAIAAALKEAALPVVGAFMAYLAWKGRGSGRVWKPLAVAAMTAAAYLAMNPLVIWDPLAGTWDVGPATLLRRFHALAGQASRRGPCGIAMALPDLFFFWPVIPAAGLAAWACRRERWFPVAGLVWAVLLLCVIESVAEMRLSAERYVDTIKQGFYFLTAVFALSAMRRAPRGNGLAAGERPKRWRLAAGAAAFVVLGGIVASVAYHAATEDTLLLDEGIWFTRARVLPSDLSTDVYRRWAIDPPAANRWIYGAVLTATGLDKVPAGEKSPWSESNGEFYWNGRLLGPYIRAYYKDHDTLEKWMAYAGSYTPRGAVLAMRAVNVTTFAVYITLMWLCALAALRSSLLATAAVVPIAVSHATMLPYGLSFYSWSGDVFMMAAMAGALLALIRFHEKGRAANVWPIVVVAGLTGLAVASKQHAMLALWAFIAYLAWQSRGWRRIANPILAASIAATVYMAVNPVMFLYPGKWPWDIEMMIVAERGDVLMRYERSFGLASAGQILSDSLYWWPIVPLALAAAWSCRREKWFPPVALFGFFLAAGTASALFRTGMLQARYMAVAEMGLFLLVSVCLMTVSLRANAAYRHSPGGTPEAANEQSLANAGPDANRGEARLTRETS
jgi:hypothetical protein